MSVEINLGRIKSMTAEEFKPQIQRLAQLLRNGGELRLAVDYSKERYLHCNLPNRVNELAVRAITSEVKASDLHSLVLRAHELNLSDDLNVDLNEIQIKVGNNMDTNMDIQTLIQEYVDDSGAVGAAVGLIDQGKIQFFSYGKKSIEDDESDIRRYYF